jgi:hypothetical protein
MTIRTCILVLFAIAGCRDDQRPAVERDVSLRPDLSEATQADLATELDQAERRGTWREVRKRWEGQRLRWTVTRHRALCGSPSVCHVAAFPVQQHAQHGWLPALSFAPGEYEKLTALCGEAPACEIEIAGRLSRLELSGELPTSVHFDDVSVVGKG